MTKTMMILMCTMMACAAGLDMREASQAVRTVTDCDPISGECVELQGNPLPGGGGGGGGWSEFQCSYSATARPGCGTFVGWLSDGVGGSGNAYLTLDVLETAAFDPNYQQGLGFSIGCAQSSDVTSGGAVCTMTQGPWHWTCNAGKYWEASTCCSGSHICTNMMVVPPPL
jgi:hypothetical protein